MAARRKNSIPETDTKLDQVLEMITMMQKDNMEHFQKLEQGFERSFQKLESEIREIKSDLTKLKVTDEKVQKLTLTVNQLQENQEEMNEKSKETEIEMEKMRNQMALLEIKLKADVLRFRGVPEEEGENIKKKMTHHLSKYINMEEDEFDEDISKVVRANYSKRDVLKRERDVLIFFSRKRTREDILAQSIKTSLQIQDKKILILKDIPNRILQKRKEYYFLRDFLRENNIRYKWEDLEGLRATYNFKSYRLTTVPQAQDFLEKLKKNLKEIPATLQDQNG
ncbi:factor of DNA methylation 3-like [Sphaerodactylus townsendi]|uniref:factor of DNA methylation 3-like n=1 Tax=Sphaerodactylus townsendi TaxID=933632 RepID=UPI002025FCFD|nr:factor of DNA methylation 3-like [Sphaerodactylus townsendi]